MINLDEIPISTLWICTRVTARSHLIISPYGQLKREHTEATTFQSVITGPMGKIAVVIYRPYGGNMVKDV